MNVTNEALAKKWREVPLGKAGIQEKIDLAWETGVSKAFEFSPQLRRLVQDHDEQVRYYALQALVLQLHERDPDIQRTCWKLVEEDCDADVRAMAARCLGRISSGAGDLETFSHLVEVIKDQKQTSRVRMSAYEALFDLAGRPPSEWPSLQVSWRRLLKLQVDWKRVAELEDQIKAETVSATRARETEHT